MLIPVKLQLNPQHLLKPALKIVQFVMKTYAQMGVIKWFSILVVTHAVTSAHHKFLNVMSVAQKFLRKSAFTDLTWIIMITFKCLAFPPNSFDHTLKISLKIDFNGEFYSE